MGNRECILESLLLISSDAFEFNWEVREVTSRRSSPELVLLHWFFSLQLIQPGQMPDQAAVNTQACEAVAAVRKRKLDDQ